MRRSISVGLFMLSLILSAGAIGTPPAGAAPATGRSPSQAASVGAVRAGRAGSPVVHTPFCEHLGTRYQASTAAQMLCFGNAIPGRQVTIKPAAGPGSRRGPANVNAASLREDVTGAGVRAYGQSEVSVAAAGRYVVEAWNDSTFFFANCPSARSKEEATGFGFSDDGGRSFTDLGGLPNTGCAKNVWLGDPSVTAYRAGGHTYFYITSLFDSPTGIGLSHVALAACQVRGSGGRARLACGQPIMAATSTLCRYFKHVGRICDFLDKDFAAIDPARGRLYVSYSSFPAFGHITSNVELGACDLGTPRGGRGPLGGTPAAPVCANGGTLRLKAPAPYFTIAHGDTMGCEDEGAYPAVDPATGAVYVGYEFNWGTNSLSGTPCASIPTRNVLTKAPLSCLPLATATSCAGPSAEVRQPVTSMDMEPVPGYSRFPAGDFPRLAVSGRAGTVTMVWNDARRDPLGSILLRSYRLRSLRPVQSRPVVLSTGSHSLNFLPAVRTATASGRLDVSWYARRTPDTAFTDVVAALGVNPRSSGRRAAVVRITTRPTNWDNVSSDINPNFGDYTDASVAVTGRPPYVGNMLYIAWSDGRLGIPQPFMARLPVR